ncbi:MAG: hypothetical protein RL303_883, partial [Verrucomicrobiota bacterium]
MGMSVQPATAVGSSSFRWYLLAMVFGTLAVQIQGVAVAWQVYEL